MIETAVPAMSSVFGRRAAICLVALLLFFATLVPGGPIESRDFSQLGGATFWGFNIFLISLGLMGFTSAVLSWNGRRSGLWAAVLVAWLFIAVVALDFGRVFPTSPDPMGLPLAMIEILVTILACYVILFAHQALGHI